MKRKLSLILALILILSLFTGLGATAGAAWDGTADAGFSGGDGSRNDPYLISTAGQLALFRDMVNSGSSDICAKLVCDIDLNHVVWEPIGLNKTGYTGIFEGGGWSIKNLYINSVSSKLTVYQSNSSKAWYIQVGGLFGVVGSGGSVKYVNISGLVSGDISMSNDTGVYIGSLAGANFGTIEECFSACSFSGLTIKNNNYIGIGGLVGDALDGSVIRNCYNVGSISAALKVTKTSHRNYIGGLIGLADCDLDNCYSAASLSITTNSTNLHKGGVVGNAGGNDLANSYFDKNVCTATSYVAGCRYSSTSPYNPSGCAPKATADMKTKAFANTLGSAFLYDYGNVNNGYPVLAVMTYGEQGGNSGWVDDELDDAEIDAIYQQIFPAELLNKDLTKSITRAEFAAVAVKLYEEMGGTVLDAATLPNPFTDTTADAVIKAYAIGLCNGMTPTEYDPYSAMSRQDMCTMLTRVYKALNLSGWTLNTDGKYSLDYSGVSYFADDAYISGYARPSVYFMVKNNVIHGLTTTVFGPKNTTPAEEAIGYANASREQSVIMAVHMFKYL